MDDFIKREGLGFLAHLLRRLSDDFVRAFEDWYPEVEMEAPARTRSTLQALNVHASLGVTELAAMLRQSHPLVINWIKQLKKLDLVVTKSDPGDGRRTLVSLTPAGKIEAEKGFYSRRVGAHAYTKLMQEAEADVFEALWRLEEACRRKPFLERLREAQRELDESAGSVTTAADEGVEQGR